MAPLCEPPLPPTSPGSPLCWGVLWGLVSQAAQRLFSNHYSGISVLQGGGAAAACPAKDLAVDKTLGRLGDTCSIFWLSGTSQPLPRTWEQTPEGSVAKPGTFLRAQDSLLCPQGL